MRSSSSRLRRLEWVGVSVLLFGLFGVEAAYFLGLGSGLRRFAALYWIGCSVALILSAVAFSFSPFLDRAFWRLPNRAGYLTAFLLPPILVLFGGGGVAFTHVDGEGVEQLAVGLSLMKHDPGLGVYSMAYFTNLARQYELNGLPSRFFGASLWTLRLGNSLFFLCSYLFFLSGLVSYLRKRNTEAPLLLASYCGIMIAFAEYTLLNARKFEQTTMPIAATLFFLGAMLLFLNQQTPLRFLWVTWVFGFLTECYTPALGSWVLALGIMLYLITRRRHRIFTVTIAYGILSLVVAFLIEQRANNGLLADKFSVQASHLTPTDRILRYMEGMRALAGFDHSLLPAPLTLGVLAALYISWRLREGRFPAICLWAIAMAFVSLTFVGSNVNVPAYDLHRALIILPPLALGIVILLARTLERPDLADSTRKGMKLAMGFSMAYMVFAGVCTVFLVRTLYGPQTLDDYDEVCADLNQLVLSPKTVRPIRIYLLPPLEKNLAYAMWFFEPDGAAYAATPPVGERVPGTYIFSYRVKDPKDRFDDTVAPSRHPRPFIQVEDEWSVYARKGWNPAP
ncbi:MAG TPA: hypothetical protein VII09_04575 [Opitutaceae bacterium]